MLPYIVSLIPVKIKNWVVKASIFDDQILIFCWNEAIMECKYALFLSEESAYQFIKRLHNE